MSLLDTLGFLFLNHVKNCMIFSTLGKRKEENKNRKYRLKEYFKHQLVKFNITINMNITINYIATDI